MLDDSERGVEVDESRSFLDPDNYINAVQGSESLPEKVMYKPIDISNTTEMLQSVRRLAPEQRKVFDIVMSYCKGLRKAISGSCPMPKAPLLKIHGGAGSGKSKLIEDISKWSEYFLRVADDRQPSQPSIIKVAPTGKAASIIDGLTLHSAFHFKFGNDFASLSDKLRDEMRKSLEKLQIVIIDEMSMMKSDLLYQLNLRLQEIKQNQDYFGGIAVLLFGDLLQLRPVQANFIFEVPKCKQFQLSHEINPLWDLFQPFELLHNHRQGGDKTYADILNRVRFGKQTAEDVAVLQSKVTSEFPPNAMYVFGTRSAVDELNMQKLTALPEKPETLKAIHIHPHKKDYRPFISDKDGTVNDTPFLDELNLKLNARVMLTFNVDTSDGLTNGTTGTVTGFVRNKEGHIVFILVRFDEPKFGEQMRAKYRHILQTAGDPSATPISKVSFEYSLGKVKRQHTAKAKVIQFPLVLAWAITAHKFQGQTVKVPNTLVADLGSVFDGGQAYVMLGRVQNIDQLYLKSFNAKNIRANQKALEEARKFSASATSQAPAVETMWNKLGNPSILKISLLNIRSLQKHLEDVKADNVILKSDVICLTETWLIPQTNPQLYQIPGFTCQTSSTGRGAGVAVYIRNEFACGVPRPVTFATKECQAIRISLSSLDILAVYRSPNTDINTCIQTVLKGIDSSKSTLICGDFNVPIQYNKSNSLTTALSTRGFTQIVNEPTHLQGNLLDHVYVRFQKGELFKQFMHCPYYSDHDAICTIIKYE